MAKSSATSRPRLRAAATKRSKSASVPSSGWTASWPPSSPPMAHGLPGSPGLAVERVVGALAMGPADGVDGRQVDDVEAHARRRARAGPPPRGTCACRPATPERGKNSYQAAKRARSRSTIDLELALGPGGFGRGRGGDPSAWPGPASPAAATASAWLGAALDPPDLGAERRASSPVAAAGGRPHERGALAQLAGHVLAGVDALAEVGEPGPERIGQRLDREELARVGSSSVKAPAHRSLSTKPHGRLAPGRRRPPAGSFTKATRISWPSLKMSALTSTRAAHLALDGVAAAVHRRGRRSR